MAVTCKNCGGAHAIWECKRPATKSTGSERSGAQAASGRPKIILFDGMGAASDKLPVDTNPPQGSRGLSDDGREVTLQRPVEGTNSGSAGLEVHSAVDVLAERHHAEPETKRTPSSTGSERGASTPKVAGSSPAASTKFDKKAWSRAYMKIWMRNKRAKLKASPGA